ncbi:leucyl aminopeptidase (aminopeptidase T) [Natranaerovirga pectinivora]|uniref:Leucyl aminopeptidase (Aminopeptidase T) n=1 Tax=Natranaerovirga pectinivora TaxID=682400 RepID=A0A4R3MJ59_9FIRM|nr:aminopeptidase [Natranaerovirga pectinivora]TCT14304.1 leucyl aminopeptidase (aminopeptidase T) [Natranaerovirga pectinivora]
MNYSEIIEVENEKIQERFEEMVLAVESILLDIQSDNAYNKYIKFITEFLIELIKKEKEINESYFTKTIDEIQKDNKVLYKDILEENYHTSYANPKYAIDTFGKEVGEILTLLYTDIRGCIPDIFEHRLYDITIFGELIIQIANINMEDFSQLKEMVQNFYKENLCHLVERRTQEVFVPLNYSIDIVNKSNFDDLRYLYKYGEYVTENELKIAQFLNEQSEDTIKLMSSTYTEAYKKGFLRDGIDISKKSTVNIRYSIGFERVVREAIKNFKEMNLEPIMYRYAVRSVNKRQHLKVGYYATSPNKQYDYDHRFDEGIYLDEEYAKLRIKVEQDIMEKYKKEARELSGPAVIEVFGEKPFKPLNKVEAIKLSDEQQKLKTKLNNKLQEIKYKYMPGDEWSFTIIAFPLPEIGDQFEAIFEDIIKVNTLDSMLYEKIQQTIIDTLDKGEFVEVKGREGNKTDIRIKLKDIQDPEKETKFENCVADVNVPVGEVFTSPVLTGTQGTLHVKEVYLNDLKYENLTLEFKEGYIKEYTCTNFKNEEENKKFIKENLMYNYESIPMGEFAIGTNTTAYVMANKYGIVNLLPILIVEKMGPHFAVGDTCYSRKEDHPSYNPDGKEIIARDNEKSILRKNDSEEAYFNCHTDITIPYDEIGCITVIGKDNIKINIIENGRFVLEGTELLNEPFKA